MKQPEDTKTEEEEGEEDAQEAREAKKAERQREIVNDVQRELRAVWDNFKLLPKTAQNKGHCYLIRFPHVDHVIVARAQLDAHGTFFQLDKQCNSNIYVYPGFKPNQATRAKKP